MLSTGYASVGLRLREEHAPAVDARDAPEIPHTVVLPHDYRLDAGSHAPAVYACNRLAPSTSLVHAPLLAHLFNHTPFRIEGYNHLGDWQLAPPFSIEFFIFSLKYGRGAKTSVSLPRQRLESFDGFGPEFFLQLQKESVRGAAPELPEVDVELGKWRRTVLARPL